MLAGAAIALLGLAAAVTVANLIWTAQWARAGRPEGLPPTRYTGGMLALAGAACGVATGWHALVLLAAVAPDACWVFARLLPRS